MVPHVQIPKHLVVAVHAKIYVDKKASVKLFTLASITQLGKYYASIAASAVFNVTLGRITALTLAGSTA